MRDRPVTYEIDTRPEALADLPSLEELGVPLESVEAVGELFCEPDGPTVEESTLSIAVRLVVYHVRSLPASICEVR